MRAHFWTFEYGFFFHLNVRRRYDPEPPTIGESLPTPPTHKFKLNKAQFVKYSPAPVLTFSLAKFYEESQVCLLRVDLHLPVEVKH